MPRAEAGSLKYLSNKMKAKGLQKLRWYCQMCEKQCRDENGFKCHIMSEGHQRQMVLFAENTSAYLDHFSQKFESDFTKLLRRRYGTRRVHANEVYKEYISDKAHLHMNATQWETLTQFIKYLGKAGTCEVEETPKGWFIKYIDRDPEVLARYEALRKREMAELDDDEIQKLMLEKQIERAKESSKLDEPVYTELTKAEDEKITINLALKSLNQKDTHLKETKSLDDDSEDELDEKESKKSKKRSLDDDDDDRENERVGHSQPLKKKSAIEEIIAQEEKKKEKLKRKDYWLTKGIIVKVLNKKLGDGVYYKKKGVVKQVHDLYVGEIEMLDSGDTIKVDQNYCETVIPGIGGRVRIVNGGYRGELAELVKLNVDDFNATLRIIHGPYNDKVIEAVPYEDFCKTEDN